ncbi:MAG: excinuclease ABC subunit UvrC [Candidatus Omnitrophota bacterium]
MDIKKKIKSLSIKPGVYLMKDKNGWVIYVGKAANIKKRVASYFNKQQSTIKNEILINQIYNVETIEASSEHEAFLLESRLIKQLKPHYNISLRDDKSFPFIKITKQDYPRIFIGRKKLGENVEYIGPYTNAKSLHLALKHLRKIFPFCSCHKFPKKECLNFYLNLCLGPCTDKISQRNYRRSIRDFKHFLKKGSQSLIKDLQERMQYFSRIKKFEEALELREKIKALGLLNEQSRPGTWENLGLDKEPNRIEAFDISNLLGNQAVGSMVTFLNRHPLKEGYRRFKIKIKEGIDDYGMLKEILNRRYSRAVKDNLIKPDLIVIDGGRGHLNLAFQQLKDQGLSIPIIAIAKEQELIYTVKKKEPIVFDKDNIILQLIQHARDEAHRFAIKYHKLLRKKQVFTKINA